MAKQVPLVINTTTPIQQLPTGDTLDAVALVRVAKAGTTVGSRTRLNFIEGTNVTITAADDAGNDEVDVTIAASGGGSPSVITPSQITANQNDYDPTGWADATTVRLSFDAAGRRISSFSATGVADGERKTLVNTSAVFAYIPCESPSGTAANRVLGTKDYILERYGRMEIEYDGTSSRWIVVSNSFNDAENQHLVVAGTVTAGDHYVAGFSGTTATGNPTGALPATIVASTGTTTTGSGTIYLLKSIFAYFVFGDCHIRATTEAYLPALSDGTNTYEAIFGVTSSPSSNSTTVNNSIHFRYSHSVNSGKWQGFTRSSAGAESTVDLGVTVAASTLYTLSVYLDKALSECRFYIGGVYCGRLTTNLPSSGVFGGTRVSITKSAGTTARTFNAKIISSNSIQ